MLSVRGLLSMEVKLRATLCNNALTKFLARLHTKHHFIAFRNENLSGQVQATRAQTLISQIRERANACMVKYRQARTALITLSGEANATQFRELCPEDVQLDGDVGESDAAARKKLVMLSAGQGTRAPRNAPGMSKPVQVEWSRARARKVRWEEEVLTLREEMQRVLRYLEWQSQWW
ncbi:hypothetical protein B0H13DRAFT_1668313 [Mycena leptocephala]|nr:hypothetical protein B0H13DRAFT_1668313 [Mycena leptocephala]